MKLIILIEDFLNKRKMYTFLNKAKIKNAVFSYYKFGKDFWDAWYYFQGYYYKVIGFGRIIVHIKDDQYFGQ